MKLLKDPMEDFIPKGETKFVILGTMASYVAREVNGIKINEPFYYHDGRNRFWGVLSLLLSGEIIKFTNIDTKKAFLDSKGVALANLVSQVEVEDSVDSSVDEVLFNAFEKERLKFKVISEPMRKLLKEKPVFFSCYKKKEIVSLLEGYKVFNQISEVNYVDRIIFLHSPTRRGYQYVADKWRESIMASHPEILR